MNSTIRLERTGPSSPSAVWAAYVRPDRWTSWAPHLTGVMCSHRRITPGATGDVRALWLVRAPFRITAVDPAARTWAWRVRVGPWRLHLVHTVTEHHDGGTRAGISLTGPWWLVAAYRPVMGMALGRLVRVA